MFLVKEEEIRTDFKWHDRFNSSPCYTPSLWPRSSTSVFAYPFPNLYSHFLFLSRLGSPNDGLIQIKDAYMQWRIQKLPWSNENKVTHERHITHIYWHLANFHRFFFFFLPQKLNHINWTPPSSQWIYDKQLWPESSLTADTVKKFSTWHSWEDTNHRTWKRRSQLTKRLA